MRNVHQNHYNENIYAKGTGKPRYDSGKVAEMEITDQDK